MKVKTEDIARDKGVSVGQSALCSMTKRKKGFAPNERGVSDQLPAGCHGLSSGFRSWSSGFRLYCSCLVLLMLSAYGCTYLSCSGDLTRILIQD
ncbi:hypothetical protein BO78DRAFT_89303 [Aspergillus sclerotiicarbonarius CBS 121057]|uniref:Uncharacterized protein n=1 Tax=Aspergillus sclerotiicarbonarius (strain CBS 121057 / IBT 28362) TaxID=1448318 RepID=A0A319ED85_ASPSB|nr:hypothetical protein BO78DRAFT_89303 [Aspergillus sclerotiicarbonarius CBS 121057]